jgi:TorA maturation chaperone TorD
MAAAPADAPLEFAGLLADDLMLLARLHAQEPGAELLAALRRQPLEQLFALRLDAAALAAPHRVLATYLDSLSEPVDVATCDDLAADFAALYLTGARRLSPSESYWLSDDHLERQQPMFAVRGWYQHYALQAGDWRRLPDDHIVLQLQFVAALLRDGRRAALRDAARFLDAHLLVWAPDFCAALAARAGSAFYAGLAPLTLACLDTLRELLQLATGVERTAPPGALRRPRPPAQGAGAQA